MFSLQVFVHLPQPILGAKYEESIGHRMPSASLFWRGVSHHTLTSWALYDDDEAEVSIMEAAAEPPTNSEVLEMYFKCIELSTVLDHGTYFHIL